MKDTETRVTFIYDRDTWRIIQMIASRLMCYRDNGSVTPCTGSDIIREILDAWLAEKSEQWFPKLLQELRQLNIQSRTRDILEQWQKEKEEEEKK